LVPDEAVMGLGEAEAPAWVETAPVPTAVPAGVEAAAAVVVLLAKMGALVGIAEHVLHWRIAELVTGLTTVQGQSVMVRVVASVTV